MEIKSLLKLIIVSVLTVTFSSCFKGEHADLIIHNANIISVDGNGTIYEAMVIRDGKILELGKERQILNKYSADEVIDANLATILPGFIDGHCHFLGYGLSQQQVQLKGALSMMDVIDKCQNYNAQNNPAWITGRGWDNTIWEDENFPNNELLNKAFPDKPVLIRRIGGHAALANDVALKLAQFTDSTIIPGGHIEVLAGKLTGIVMDNAVDKILELIPAPTKADKTNAILQAQRDCFALGLTTVDDAGLNKEDVQLLQEMEANESLKMKIYVMLSDNPENFSYFIDSAKGPFRSKLLNVNAFKFYGDGALGARSACLIKPYADVKDTLNYGFLLQNPSYFKEKAQKVYDAGFQMCTHCIGDSAARIILDSYGSVLGGSNDKRWRIEHAQVLHPDDFSKFREFSILPSVQPTHATSDMGWATKRLGKNRVQYSYAYYSLLAENGFIILGTDFPIENINPIETFYAAVARKDKSGLPADGFMKNEALTRTEALRGMTIWAALGNFEENQKGSLEIGKDADFIFLSQDLMEVPEDMILNTSVTATYVNGICVFQEN
ncbi:MAG: putative amidohydrolase YtcJ [Parvicella sp.]|jgi:predicted amidohydrolase YtcJ